MNEGVDPVGVGDGGVGGLGVVEASWTRERAWRRRSLRRMRVMSVLRASERLSWARWVASSESEASEGSSIMVSSDASVGGGGNAAPWWPVEVLLDFLRSFRIDLSSAGLGLVGISLSRPARPASALLTASFHCERRMWQAAMLDCRTAIS